MKLILILCKEEIKSFVAIKFENEIDCFSIKKNQVYDENGIFLENSQDLCDCLDLNCHGCHFPCPKCGSQKCGAECRCGRKWIYEHVEVEGANLILKWPQAENSSKW